MSTDVVDGGGKAVEPVAEPMPVARHFTETEYGDTLGRRVWERECLDVAKMKPTKEPHFFRGMIRLVSNNDATKQLGFRFPEDVKTVADAFARFDEVSKAAFGLMKVGKRR